MINEITTVIVAVKAGKPTFGDFCRPLNEEDQI